MKPLTCAGIVLLLLPGPVWSDHQRVAQQARPDHRWEASLGASLTPWSGPTWDFSLAPRLGYEFQGSWQVAVDSSWTWSARPEEATVQGGPGPWGLSAAWTPTWGDARWRLGAGVSAPWAGRGPEPLRVNASLGVSTVRDPAILAAGLGWSAPVPATLAPGVPPGGSLTGNLSFQEVVNDNLVWSLALSPRLSWSGGSPSPGRTGVPELSLGVSWGLGWYEEPLSLSFDNATGTGQAWTLSATGSRSW
jgi:hypothetical protein